MALYRTKPEEVEAIQYTGNMAQPFEKDVPAWVWSALATRTLQFNAHGLEISYNGLNELVVASDWLVLHSDGIIRCCNSEVFKTFYTPYKHRRTKAEIEAERRARAIAGTIPVEGGVMIPISDDMTEADIEAVVAQVGSVNVAAE